MEYKDNSGLSIEYYAKTLKEIVSLLTSRCQTISYLGVAKEDIIHLFKDSKPKGVDPIVPIGKTMDFDLTWDGYNLVDAFTRKVRLIF